MSILAALFVPLLGDQRGEGDETPKVYMIKQAVTWKVMILMIVARVYFSTERGLMGQRRADRRSSYSGFQEHLCLPRLSDHNCLRGWKGRRGRDSRGRGESEGEARGGLRSRRRGVGRSADERASMAAAASRVRRGGG